MNAKLAPRVAELMRMCNRTLIEQTGIAELSTILIAAHAVDIDQDGEPIYQIAMSAHMDRAAMAGLLMDLAITTMNLESIDKKAPQ